MNINSFAIKKQNQEKITMLTCYDYPSARIISKSAIDCVLVGDSVAMAVHGHSSTIMATMEMMALHTQAVARGLDKQFLIADLPFLSNRINKGQTIENAKILLQAGANAVKIEGADDDVCLNIKHLVASGIPVMGHIGLTPQAVHQLGGYKVQGKSESQAQELITSAHKLQQAGCFAIVIECVPADLGKKITEQLAIPTIGIGAGQSTDGQVLVWHDLLGLQTEMMPRFVKQYINGHDLLLKNINDYAAEVKDGSFPTAKHAY